MAEGNGNGNVTFSTKELIIQLDGKVETLLTLVSAKADAASVNSLQLEMSRIKTQVEHRNNQSHGHANQLLIHEGRLVKLELDVAARSAVDRYKKWLLTGAGLVGVQTAVGIVLIIKQLVT